MSRKMMGLILFLILLPFPIVFSLIIPNGKNRNGEQNASKYIVGFVETETEDSWKASVNDMVREICEERGYHLFSISAERNQESQTEAVRSLIAYQVDLIVFSPVIVRNWTNVLKEAKDAQIPVLTLDKGISETMEGVEISYIGFDYYGAAEELAECYLEEADLDDVVLELFGTVGSYSSLQITKGFRETFRLEGGEQDERITYSLSQDFLQSRAEQATRQILNSDTGLDVILSHGDAMTIGAVSAIEEAGLEPGRDVCIFTVSGGEEVRQMRREGKVNCVSFCDVDLLYQALQDGLEQILKGEKHILQVVLPTQLMRGGEG